MSDNDPDVSTDEEAGADEDEECFVIAPIGDPRTETQRRTNGLLDEVIRPVAEEALGLDVTAAHKLPEAGSITRQVIQRLLQAELVIADLTDLNPNVMYELAVRHAKGRPVVPIAEDDTSLPFDITTERTIFYEESFHGLSELKPELEEAARAALEDEEPDNPIYRAQQDFQMREAVAGDDAMGYVIDRLDKIEASLGRTDQRHGASPSERSVIVTVSGSLEEIADFEDRFIEAHNAYIRGEPAEVIQDWDLFFEQDGDRATLLITYTPAFKNAVDSMWKKAANDSGVIVEKYRYGAHFDS